jgi:hypothetical protein
MTFDFATLVSHIARTRNARANPRVRIGVAAWQCRTF